MNWEMGIRNTYGWQPEDRPIHTLARLDLAALVELSLRMYLKFLPECIDYL